MLIRSVERLKDAPASVAVPHDPKIWVPIFELIHAYLNIHILFLKIVAFCSRLMHLPRHKSKK